MSCCQKMKLISSEVSAANDYPIVRVDNKISLQDVMLTQTGHVRIRYVVHKNKTQKQQQCTEYYVMPVLALQS